MHVTTTPTIKAAETVKTDYDSITDMLEFFEEYQRRLEVQLDVIRQPGVQNRSDNALVERVIVEFLAHLLSVIGLSTKLVREKRPGWDLFYVLCSHLA